MRVENLGAGLGPERVKAKAYENLEAARRLLARGLLNAAASRLYFALFQASVHSLERKGPSTPPIGAGSRSWSHGAVEECVAGIRGQREDRRRYTDLRILREVADYESRSVTRRALEFLLRDAEGFIREVTS